MRRALLIAGGVALGTGCGAFNAEGRWDITLWEVDRGGQVVATGDGGWMDWQEDPDHGLRTLLRYAYDADAFELVPQATPDLVSCSADTYGFDRESEVISISLGQETDAPRAQFWMIAYKPSTMVLESDPLVDGSVHRWELVR